MTTVVLLNPKYLCIVVMIRIHQNSVFNIYPRIIKRGLDDRGESKGIILNLNQDFFFFF